MSEQAVRERFEALTSAQQQRVMAVFEAETARGWVPKWAEILDVILRVEAEDASAQQ